MIERTRLSFLTGAIAAAALLFGGPTLAPAGAADEDPNLARLMAPCYQALRAEESVRPLVYANSHRLAAAHQEILNALQTNSHCSSTLSPMASMHLATDAFLWSLLAQDEELLGYPNWHHSLDVADGLLSQCVAAPDLVKQGVSSRCQNQRSFNVAFAREPYANDPCRRALNDEQNATDQLGGPDIDPTRTQTAYKDANDGLAQVDRCQSPPMRLVTKAYLLSLQGEAQHDLDIAGWDRTFDQADDLLTQCTTTLQRLPNDVAKNCATQLAANQQLVKDYRDSMTAQPGTATPEQYTPVAWSYPVTAGFSPANLTAPHIFAATVTYDTFAAIGNKHDLTTMFDFGAAGAPATYDDKFFRSNLLLFVISQRNNQQCVSRPQDVHLFTPTGAAGAVPVTVLDYSLTCQPPATGAQPPAVLAVQVPRPPISPTAEVQGQVEFVENGVHHRLHYYVPVPPHH